MTKENSCSSEHSKLCFGQPEMIRASQNKLATRLKAREGFPPKSEIHDGKSETENLNAYGRNSKRRTRRSTGRKPKTDPAVFRYGIKLTSEENGNFELLFEKSGMKQRARFIKAMIFGREMKVVRIDKAAMDYYIRLTNFYHQFQAIGNNYNQTVKAVKSNFGEKRAFALLRNLEKATIDLVVLSKRIIMLTREFEEEYLIKRKKEEQQNGG